MEQVLGFTAAKLAKKRSGSAKVSSSLRAAKPKIKRKQYVS
jgi:hypothetical protein